MATKYHTTLEPDAQTDPDDEIRSSPRKTYPQQWFAYNAAQTSEKDTFHRLLTDLCANVQQPTYIVGRPRFPFADMVYVGAIKVYSGFSARRFNCDVQDAHSKGIIDAAPSFNTVNRYIANPDLIQRSAAPLALVESSFAADSSGFSTCRFERWFDAKWGKEKSQRQWLKAHIVCGTKTNIVTAVKITDGSANDSPILPKLLNGTTQHFNMAEVSADKAYLSESNLQEVASHGAVPYIPFKSNTTGKGSSLWRWLYGYFITHEDEWSQHYHKRSNVETTFSMIKGKFGDALRSKSPTGQVNEILLKMLCHGFAPKVSLESKVRAESEVVSESIAKPAEVTLTVRRGVYSLYEYVL